MARPTPARRAAALATALVGVLAATLEMAAPAAAAPAPPAAAYQDLGADAPPAARYRSQTVTWGPCSWFAAGRPGPVPECATITVPRDWTRPGTGADLSVAISRTRATDTAGRLGILFTNPGGPGGSGIALSQVLAAAQPQVAARYDVIGMDPRGVGFSTRLACTIDSDDLAGIEAHDVRDYSPAALADRQKVVRLIADGCAAEPLTRYINTWQTVHDMDLVRVLLGERRLDYVGYSYGTWLGAKYAAVFPRTAGRVVLDANTEWTGDLSASWLLQPRSFQRRFARHFGSWATRNPVFSRYLGTTPRAVVATYEQDRAAYARYRAQVTDGAETTAGTTLDNAITQDMYVDTGFVSTAYNLGLIKSCVVDNQDYSREVVARCIAAYDADVANAVGSDPAAAASASSRAAALLLNPVALPRDPQDPVGTVMAAAAERPAGEPIAVPGVFWAVRCGDGGRWYSPAWWIAFGAIQGRLNPLAGYRAADEVCAHWSAPVQPLPSLDARRLRTPIVTVQSEFDPATAYESTIRNLRRFPAARLVAIDDGGIHGDYGIRGNGCVDDTVNAFLLAGAVPPARTLCAGLPLPGESTVVPVPGPVDRSTGVRPTQRRHVDPRVREQADVLIR